MKQPSEKNLKRQFVVRQVLAILAVIILGSVMVYGINSQFSRSAFFTLVITYYLVTKNRLLGISLLFILILNPWGLFYYKPYDVIIPLTQRVGVSYQIPFALAIIVRHMFNPQDKGYYIVDYMRPYYKYFFLYFLFLIIWGSVYGYSDRSMYDLLMSLTVLTIFFVLPRSFNYDSMILFNSIIFLFCLVHTAVIILDITMKGTITNMLIFGREASTSAIWSDELTRLIGGIGISFYSLIAALYYLASRENRFKPWFLWLILFVSWFAVINTATRGWMIASIFLVSTFSIYYIKSVFSKSNAVTGIFIAAFVILFLLPGNIKNNLNSAFKRLSTVETIAEGDMTAGGTAGRWTVRGPRVLTRFNESPVFGFGFSNVTAEYWDEHVGNHILLLMGGIVGFVILWGTFLAMLIFIYRLEKAHKYYTGVFVAGMGLMAVMIIHSTSRLMVSYIMPADSAFVLAILFSMVNVRIFQLRHGQRKTSAIQL